jgi:hypothetical protein
VQAVSRHISQIDSRLIRTGDVFEQLDVPHNRRAVKLYDIWCRHKPRDDIPRRADLSFEVMGAAGLLGRLFIIEPIDGGRDWRYRLLGCEITWLFGRDVTNVPFSRHFQAEEAEVCIALSNQVAETRIPMFLRGSIQSGRYTGVFETMSLPVWSRDRSTVWLFGGTFVDY